MLDAFATGAMLLAIVGFAFGVVEAASATADLWQWHRRNRVARR